MDKEIVDMHDLPLFKPEECINSYVELKAYLDEALRGVQEEPHVTDVEFLKGVLDTASKVIERLS